MLLLLDFLDDPVHAGVGGLQPVAIQRTLSLIDQQLEVVGRSVTIPCDATGHRRDRGGSDGPERSATAPRSAR